VIAVLNYESHAHAQARLDGESLRFTVTLEDDRTGHINSN